MNMFKPYPFHYINDYQPLIKKPKTENKIKVSTQEEFDHALKELQTIGGTIYLGKGSFELPHNFPKNIHIIGVNYQKTTFQWLKGEDND